MYDALWVNSNAGNLVAAKIPLITLGNKGFCYCSLTADRVLLLLLLLSCKKQYWKK